MSHPSLATVGNADVSGGRRFGVRVANAVGVCHGVGVSRVTASEGNGVDGNVDEATEVTLGRAIGADVVDGSTGPPAHAVRIHTTTHQTSPVIVIVFISVDLPFEPICEHLRQLSLDQPSHPLGHWAFLPRRLKRAHRLVHILRELAVAGQKQLARPLSSTSKSS